MVRLDLWFKRNAPLLAVKFVTFRPVLDVTWIGFYSNRNCFSRYPSASRGPAMLESLLMGRCSRANFDEMISVRGLL